MKSLYFFSQKKNISIGLYLYCYIAWLILFVYACTSSASKNPAQNNVPVISDSIPIPNKNADTVDTGEKKDSIASQTSRSSSKRTLTPADVQYLDLIIIEEHPEIILYHEDDPETIAFANELKHYFKSRYADMRSNGVATPQAEKGRDKKFYIHHVGDNLFRVYVFNEWEGRGK